MTYSANKFEVATCNGVGGYTLQETDGRTDGRKTDQFWYEINIPIFLKKKAGINIIAAHIWNIVNGGDDMLQKCFHKVCYVLVY